jgi:hypothetical protein
MSITRAQIARQLYAKGGNTGYSDFASPSSTTASQDFATQAVSGGQTDYSGGGGSYDYIPQPPMAQVKTDPIKGGDNIPAWAKHAMTTLAMRGSLNKRPITNYGFQSGADFQLNFPNLDPRVTAVLASGYQLGQEGLRSLNPFGGNFLDFKGAFNTAQESAAKNIEGALAADLNVLSPEEIASGREYAESVGINNNVYINKARGGRVNYARGGNTGYSDFASPSSTTASQDFATQAVSGGQTDYGGGGGGEDSFNKNLNRINTGLRSAGAVNNVKNAIASKGLLSFPAALAMSELYHLLNSNKNQTAINNLELLKSGLAQGGRVNYANGGRGYSDFASPSSTTASQDFATQAVSGGSDGGSYDYIPQPTVAELNKINTSEGNRYVNPNKTVIETLRDSNLSPSFQRRAIDRFLADQYARKVDRLAPYVIGDMDEDYYLGDLPTAESLGLKNSPTTLPGGKTNVPVGAEYLGFSKIGLPALGLQPLTNLLDKAFAPPATLEGAIATRNKMQGIYDDIGRIGQLGFEDKYMNNPPPTIDGGDNQPIKLPIIAEAPSDVDGTLSDFDLYMQNLRTAQPNPFMLDPRFAAAQGGVARQAYGLGSLVRKITRPIKKILKSDVGKAAIGLASLYYGPKLFKADKGFSSWKDVNFLKSMQDKPLPWILGASAAAGLASSQEEEEDLDQISSREDNSGLRELMATYKPLRFEVQSPYRLAANGGRMGYEEGGNINPADLPMSRESLPTYENIETGEEVEYPYENKERSSAPDIDAELFQMYLDAIGSGKIPRSTTFDQYKELMGEKASMSPERTMANEGGLMNLGGNEMDLRGGGFVPLGAKEKADDVPARLSKNEFVFTADAVRAAGGGDVDRGANLMYKTMKNLESRVG